LTATLVLAAKQFVYGCLDADENNADDEWKTHEAAVGLPVPFLEYNTTRRPDSMSSSE
jgi:hypothetical protein